MAEVAAHLVDRVLPRVPVRQWVLTLPMGLRYLMAYDNDLTSAVLREFLRAVFGSLRRRARKGRPIRYRRCGAVTFIQRFGDALNLNPHFHALVLDGVYDLDDPDGSRFIALPPPDEASPIVSSTCWKGVVCCYRRRPTRCPRHSHCSPGWPAPQYAVASQPEPGPGSP